MKGIKHLLAAMFVLAVVASCGKKVEVTLSESNVTFAPEGATIEVALTSNGEWNVDTYPEWLTLSPISGKGDALLKLTAPVNDESAREGEVRVSTKDHSATLWVAQEPRTLGYLTLSLNEIEVEAEGGTFEIAVTSNCDWTINNDTEWISCDPSSGSGNASVSVTITSIEDDVDNRQAVIVFVGADNATASVNVTQHNPQDIYITVNPNILAFDYTESTLSAIVLSNSDWVAACDASWVTLSATSGNGDTQLEVTVAENTMVFEARVAHINFSTATGAVATLDVKQEGAPDPHFLEVNPTTFNFEKEGGTAEININCDTDWEVDLQSDWVSLSALGGTGNSTITLSVTANTIAMARNLTFRVFSGFLSRSLTVRQEAGDEPVVAYFEQDTVYPTYTGGFQHINLVANASWQLEASVSWISLMDSSGEGNASIDFIVDLNSSPEPRIGYLNVLHNEHVMNRLVVVQEGKPNLFETDITELEVHPDGGEFIIHLTANQAWTLNWDVEWLSCSPTSGNGNSDIVVHVEASNNPRPRTGNIKIVGSTGVMIVVIVSQHE